MGIEDRLLPLSYAVRPRVVLKYLGQLCLAVAGLTLLPLAVAVGYGDYEVALRYALVLGLLLAVGVPAGRLRAPTQIQTNEALVVTAGIFALSALLMAYPLAAAGLSPLDALFEAVSGVTTTGLTTLASVAERPPSFLFARAWLQWYGGLGIVVLSLALLVGPGTVARRLMNSAGEGEDLIGSTRGHARRVLGVYLALTLVGIGALWAATGAPFTATVHTLAAVSTGGFSSLDRSLAALNGPAQALATGLGLLGAIALPVYYHAYRGGWRVLPQDLQARALLLAALAVALALSWSLWDAGWSWLEALRHGALLAVSAQTTTGFSSLEVGALQPAAKLTLAISMLVGGGLGSTAGGMKLLRVLIVLRLLQLLVLRTRLPSHAVVEPRLGEQRLEHPEIERAMLVVLLFILVVVLSWLPFVALGYNPLDALFEVVSATATVGLSTGITATGLEPGLKVLLCVDMLLGRLEIVALLIVLYRGTWFGRRAA